MSIYPLNGKNDGFIISITYKLSRTDKKTPLKLGSIQNITYLCITIIEYLLTNLK